MAYDVVVEVRLRAGISDPQGSTIERSLPVLGFKGVRNVRVGKCFRFQLDADSESDAKTQVAAMCERLLANPVIEDFEVLEVVAAS